MRKYRALRFVIGLYRVLAWVVLVLGVLGALAIILGSVFLGRGALGESMPGLAPLMRMRPGVVEGIITGLMFLLSSALLFVVLWACSDFVTMLLDIEQNTREAAVYLKGELKEAPPRPDSVRWDQGEPPQ